MTLFIPFLLVSLWLLAWGDLSVANLLSGIALVTVLLLAFAPNLRRTRGVRMHPLATARLVLYVLRELLVSNVLVAREILSRRSRIRTGVVSYRLEHHSDLAVALIANIIALTPGTMTVDVTRDPLTLYVHFLLLSDVEQARRTIARLERLVVAAVGARSATDETIDERERKP